jgi:hypothetical protein
VHPVAGCTTPDLLLQAVDRAAFTAIMDLQPCTKGVFGVSLFVLSR